jgi:hypothetical protein
LIERRPHGIVGAMEKVSLAGKPARFDARRQPHAVAGAEAPLLPGEPAGTSTAGEAAARPRT